MTIFRAPLASSRKSAPPATAIADGSDLWLFELVPRIQRLQDIALRDMEPSITFGQFRLLQRVAEGRDTLTAIAQASTLSLPTLSERIEGTVKKGLLRRKSSPADGRAWILILTRKGSTTIAEATERLQLLHQWMLGASGHPSYRTFRRTGVELDEKLIVLLRDLERGQMTFSEAVSTKIIS